MTHNLDNANDPGCSNTQGRQNEDQLSAETSPDSIPQRGAGVTHLYQIEEDAGCAVPPASVHHKQVRPIIEAARKGNEMFVSPTAPYVAPKSRADGAQSRDRKARLAALQAVLYRHPDVELVALLARWSSTSPSNPAYQYRSAIAKNLGISWDKAKTKKPSLRTLQRDCEDLRAADSRAS